MLKETVEAPSLKTFKNGLNNVMVDPALGRKMVQVYSLVSQLYTVRQRSMIMKYRLAIVIPETTLSSFG